MGNFLITVLVWLIFGFLIVGLISFIVSLASIYLRPPGIKVYYDDTDHSKGYYYVAKPRDTYPVGYPREQILKDKEEYERLKREQKIKRRIRRADERENFTIKPRPMWLQILLMTPADLIEYRRKRKERMQR